MVIKWFYSLLLIMLPSLLTPIFSVAGTVSEVTYNSTTSGGNRKMMVYLPDGYNGTTYFPTFYLVHGGGQDHNAWVREGDAKGILDYFKIGFSTGNVAGPYEVNIDDIYISDGPMF